MTEKSASEKLVLGLGGTVDYEIAWDSLVIEELVAGYAIRSAELTTSIAVRSERDLVVSLLAFLRDGVGGERFVASSGIVEQFAARFRKRITLGGTPVRAALGMRALGVTCTLHLVSIDDTVRRLLPAGCGYVCSAAQDSTDPHLIVQFRAGTSVRSGDIELVAPHPNRIIYTNDPPNREMVLSEELGSALSKAEIFMISGFNTMQEEDLLDDRLRGIRKHLQQLPPTAVVYYEDAGFHVPAMSQRVRDALLDVIDVYSMNEDELQAYLGRSLDLLDVEEMARALVDVHALVPAATLVIHTKYWSLALGDRAESYEEGLRGGITMASTRYAHGDDFGEREYRAVSMLPVHPRGADLAAGLRSTMGSAVCCVPAFVVDVEHPTTIGLGDTFAGGFIAALART